jgi:hypothetical protein
MALELNLFFRAMTWISLLFSVDFALAVINSWNRPGFGLNLLLLALTTFLASAFHLAYDLPRRLNQVY